MKIRIDDKFLAIIFENKHEEIIVKSAFTFQDNSKVFTGGSYNSKYIKKVCFINKKGEYSFLYSGFLQDLLNIIKQNNIKVSELSDKRTKFNFQKRKYTNEELGKFFPKFKYIEHQIRELRSLLKTNVGIIEAAPSSGKSELMIAYIKATRLPTLILVNRISLAIQMKDRILKNGIKKVGVVYGGANEDGDVVVATIGSIKKIPNLHKFVVLLVDETHSAQTKQFQDFLEKTPYPIRFGFSATPNSGDKYKWALIRQFMGNVICKVEANELIKNEVIALPKIEFINVSCPKTIDWPSANLRCIVDNNDRNNKIKNLVEKHDTPTLILVRNIEHGEALNELISGSIFVSGIDDALKRKRIIEDFESGTIDTIIATTIFNEGISINAIRMLIIASAGKSKVEAIQRLGRSLRIMEDKKEVLVYDFMDNGNFFTEKHSKRRKSIYKKCGFDVI